MSPGPGRCGTLPQFPRLQRLPFSSQAVRKRRLFATSHWGIKIMLVECGQLLQSPAAVGVAGGCASFPELPSQGSPSAHTSSLSDQEAPSSSKHLNCPAVSPSEPSRPLGLRQPLISLPCRRCASSPSSPKPFLSKQTNKNLSSTMWTFHISLPLIPFV